jgi:parvulin-like peptidyl-prolyl isomerase
MKRQAMIVLAAASVLAACDGFKEALSAHADVVAKAGDQELSVERLAELLGNSQVPLQKDVAKSVAGLWVDYQLLATAAANNDSLTDTKRIDEAMWSAIAQERTRLWGAQVMKSLVKQDTAAAASRYAQGDLLAARHILLALPQTGLSTAAQDSIRRKAESLRAQATAGNFAQLAAQNSMDPGSAQQGGLYAGFPRGQMVPEFEKALVALQPGQISPLVKTDFGYHIIYRPTFAEVREQVVAAASQSGVQQAESTYFAGLEKRGNIVVKPEAAATVKKIAADLEAHADDRTVIATSTAGNFTAARMARWIGALPPQTRPQIASAADSLVNTFVKQIVRNELVLKEADSAKVTLDTTTTNNIRRQFGMAVTGSWQALGVDPKSLADSAKTGGEKEKLAAARIESYMNRLLSQQAQFVEVPTPLESLLRDKYDYKLNDAGIDRALERAQRIRAVADSTRASQQPPSAVPMPGAPGAQPGAQPQPQQPPQQPPQGTPQPAPPAPRRP